MRTALLVKNTMTTLLALSFSAAIAAPPKKVQIDKEIQAIATNANKNSQARVKKAKAVKKAPITQMASPAAAAVNTDTTAFEDFSAANPTATSTTSLKEAKSTTKASEFSAKIGLTMGKDSNATVEKAPIEKLAPVTKGSFYEVAPSIGYKGEIFSTKLAGKIKDFSDQSLSDNAKESSVTADLAADYSLGIIKATTKLDFENSYARWPDYLNGESPRGMPLRYFQSRISQTLTADFDQLNVQLGGSFANKDYSTPYSDNPSDHILGQTIYEQDQQIAEANMRVGAKLAESFEVAMRPVIRHTQYINEPARQTNGQKGGAALDAVTPRREVIRQEGNLDLVFKTTRVNITPTFTFGNDSDEALGALDATYRGGSIKAEFTLDEASSLRLGGSFKYQEKEFDNWTYTGLNQVFPNNETRRDVMKTTTAFTSVNLSKNIGISLNYTLIVENSNWEAATDLNYEQEIVGTTLTVSF